MYVVIMAGGSGTRFWPLSRTRTPKQLMSVFGGKSMLQRTVERVLPLAPERIMIVTNEEQAAETARQTAGYHGCPLDIVAEPVGRNTAPAIALAAAIIGHHDPEATMLVLPADHYIRNEAEFCRVAAAATEAAASGALITLGIEPTRPETGYGYIEAEPAPAAAAQPVRCFVEKPDAARAMAFLEAGNFYWNSGMFIWRVSAIRRELSRQMPELALAVNSLVFGEENWGLEALTPQINAIYPSLKSESIDYGVMERATQVKVIPASFGWSDVGSWSALPEVIEADGDGIVAIATAGVINIDSAASLVYGNGKMIALVGVDNLIVVDTPDALLVCRRERAQEVKKVVEKLQQQGLREYL
ncbi:MAG: mannose-phosphate guanylyltransferase [Deltaproteobacteria bacterium]|nr:mannose-phosphate guanylyltransferase [Deltaproteobacteria bacterium]